MNELEIQDTGALHGFLLHRPDKPMDQGLELHPSDVNAEELLARKESGSGANLRDTIGGFAPALGQQDS